MHVGKGHRTVHLQLATDIDILGHIHIVVRIHVPRQTQVSTYIQHMIMYMIEQIRQVDVKNLASYGGSKLRVNAGHQ